MTTVKVGIIKQMQARGSYSSGKTASRVRVVVEGEYASLIAPGYIQTLVHGRPPGKMPPIKDLIDYAAAKQINVWALAKSIAAKGTLIWQGKKQGIDIKAEIDAHRDEFLKRVGKQVKFDFIDTYKKTKK